MRPLTADMSELEKRPYFLWDEDVSIAELKAALGGPRMHPPLVLAGDPSRPAALLVGHVRASTLPPRASPSARLARDTQSTGAFADPNAESSWERERLFGKMLREARDVDVWCFVTPCEVAEALPRLARRIGRRYKFWDFLIRGWQEDGLLQG